MYGIDLDTPLPTEEMEALVDSIAKRVVNMGLETPAVLFLETHKPLSFIASQGLLVAMPFFAPIVGAQRMADFSKLLKNRENIDLLIDRIEYISAEKDKLEKPSTEGQG
jgi:hypothetical protein